MSFFYREGRVGNATNHIESFVEMVHRKKKKLDLDSKKTPTFKTL